MQSITRTFSEVEGEIPRSFDSDKLMIDDIDGIIFNPLQVTNNDI